MPLTKCPHCGRDFGSGAGLASHYRARNANGGRCGDSRQSNKPRTSQGSPASATQITFRTPNHNAWTMPIGGNFATPASLANRTEGVTAPLPSGAKQADSLGRMKNKAARLEEPRADSPMPPSEPMLLGRGRPSEWMLSARPDIRDVPVGEEGMWQIDPATKKRKLSTLSGLPILDRTSRDFAIHEARRYEPWKLGPNGTLL